MLDNNAVNLDFNSQEGTIKKADQLMEKQSGQDVIDSLSILQVTASTLHQDLWSNLVELFPKLTIALQSRFAIIRQCTARCFASLCNVVTAPAIIGSKQQGVHEGKEAS